MNTELVKSKIENVGHRVQFGESGREPISLNVRRDEKGEFFTIDMNEDVKPSVLDIDGDHLLLMFKVPSTMRFQPDNKFKALIGHDERQLFVAAIPESDPVSTVFQAKEALKPQAVREFEKMIGVKTKSKHARHAKGKLSSLKRRRQGDFFFIPRPNIEIPEDEISKKEPISRGAGASHICEELARTGGVTIYLLETTFHIKNKSLIVKNKSLVEEFREKYSSGITEEERREFLKKHPKAKTWHWTARRGGGVRAFVRGTIRHHEHATLVLDIWHEVVPNTESRSRMARHLAFID